MKSFISRFGALILSILSGFDRLRFRGCSRLLNNDRGVNSYLYQRDLLIKAFPDHAEQLTKRLLRGTEALAQAEGIKIHYLNSPNTDKEATALQIAQERSLTSGRIAILSCVESCRTFRVRTQQEGRRHIHLRKEEGRCQHFYHYFLHEQVGLCYVRLQSWFPFSIRIGLNGRTWLYQQLQRAGIGYQRRDNMLLAVDDWPRAQQLLDDQLHTNWPALLDGLMAKANPLWPYLCEEARVPYYWTTEQSEWATDILFRRVEDFARLYPRFLRHSIDVLNCRDVLHFLGRKQPEHRFQRNLKGEVKIDVRDRQEGTRAKLWYEKNSVKIYDKVPHGLRLETTINQPGSFTVYRPREGDDTQTLDWRKMRKGVADLHRQAEVSQRTNERLAESLATVADTTALGKLLEPLGRPVIDNGKRTRALNPLTGADGQLLRTVAQGDFMLQGFRNRDLRVALHGTPQDKADERRQAARISRQLAMLRAHGLIIKVQKTHRYQVSVSGRRILSALLAANVADVGKLAAAA
jgi:hypothetical protein